MTTKPVHSVPDAWRRVLVLHAYPPDPRLHTFERGLRQLGHDVVAAGPPSDTVPIEAWREVDAELTYVSVDPEASLDEVFAATGGVPDWVLYLRPPTAFLPRGLRDCPVPTVAWFEEEFRYLDVFLRLAPYFDIVGTAYEQVQRTYASRGIDNGRLFNYVTAAWLTPTGDVRFRGRPTDVSFVGNTDSRAARLRGLDLEKLSRLAAEGIRVDIRDRVYLWDMMDVYARSKIVFQRSGQGPPHLTYRVGEAMSAGAMVLAKHPVHASGLPRPLVGGEHLVYYADFDEAAELIRHYLANEDERVAIAEAGHRYVREEAPWLTQVAAFLQQHVYSIPAHYAAARRARLARLDIDTRRAQLDRAYYFAVCGDRPDVARREIERIPDWWVDPEARGLRAATERGKEPGRDFLADVRFVLEQDAGNLATVSNYAVRTWQARDSLPREHTMRVVKQALDAFDMAPPRERRRRDRRHRRPARHALQAGGSERLPTSVGSGPACTSPCDPARAAFSQLRRPARRGWGLRGRPSGGARGRGTRAR